MSCAVSVSLQVSVRRSGLGVASRMLAEFPSSEQVASMWVRAALPLIRDADQSLQVSWHASERPGYTGQGSRTALRS